MDTAQRSEHLCLGSKGEDIAANFLLARGYVILEKNWRLGHRELDIIAIHGKELVAVEVKTRTEPVLDDPAMAINKKKQQHLIRAAHAYVRMNRIPLDVRFDIIWIRMDSVGRPCVEHIQDAFIPGL